MSCRAEKLRCYQKSWSKFWIDLSGFSCFWQVLHIFFSGRAEDKRCPLPAVAQRNQTHYATIGQPRSHPDFDARKLSEAQGWLSAFLISNRGVDNSRANKFQASHVETAFRRLHLCAAGVDGLNKRWLTPAATLMLHEIFSALRFSLRFTLLVVVL